MAKSLQVFSDSPSGAMGAEIFVKIDGPPPTDEKQCTFLTFDAAIPYVIDYEGS